MVFVVLMMWRLVFVVFLACLFLDTAAAVGYTLSLRGGLPFCWGVGAHVVGVRGRTWLGCVGACCWGEGGHVVGAWAGMLLG